MDGADRARSIRSGVPIRSGSRTRAGCARCITQSLSATLETGESKQVTDGLADAVWPAFDANGKYLWFLASTDFGLRSQWLDMTSYDHNETFGLYLAVLKKGDSSPLLPESDEDRGVGTGRRTVPGQCVGDTAGGGGGGGGEATRSSGSRPATNAARPSPAGDCSGRL